MRRRGTRPGVAGHGSRSARGGHPRGSRRHWHAPVVPRARRRGVSSGQGGADGTARREEGARLRRRQRPLDRVGHRPRVPRAGRHARLLVGRVADRAPRPAARGEHRLDVRGAVRRPGRRPDRGGLRALASEPTATSTSSSTPSRSRSARTSKAASSGRPATASRWPSTSAPTRSSRSPARRGRS